MTTMDSDTENLIEEWSKAIHRNWVANRVEGLNND